ncbi:MAG: hypothetical protein J7604_16650 [Sporocytophaga sp.]|uniref:hypothetical protein n=1 Tax=Sporocytophaga sp. TaxID=2231183 RepID=UPI001AFF6957|nr:hypothetical protein [Sporocytophaga sp.]MBO9701839.1 hypothetical protein [Sporocytophaga sp.]
MTKSYLFLLILLLLNSVAYSQRPWRQYGKKFRKAIPKDIPEMITIRASGKSLDDTARFSSMAVCSTPSFYMSKYEITNLEFCKFLNVDSIGQNSERVKQLIQLNNEECKIIKDDNHYIPKKVLRTILSL